MRLGVVGPGAMGQRHAQLVNRHPRAIFAGFVHPEGDKYHYHSQETAPCYPTIGDIVERGRLDGLIIASPNQQHAKDVETALAHDIPVLVEKPLASSYEEAENLVKIRRHRQVPILVGHHRLHSNITKTTRDVLISGILGKIICIQGAAKYLKPQSYFAAKSWRSAPGAGPLRINFAHDLASLIFWLGPICEVSAYTSPMGRNSVVETTATINMRFASGVLGSFLVSDCTLSGVSWERTAGENPYFGSGPDRLCYEISGTKGSLRIPSLEIVRAVGDLEGSWNEPYDVVPTNKTPNKDALAEQLTHFLAVLERIETPLVTAEFGAEVVAVLDAISRSSANGRSESPQIVN